MIVLITKDKEKQRNVMSWALRVSREIRDAGGIPEQRLKDKCTWEHMSRTAVIIEWGDPRDWDND